MADSPVQRETPNDVEVESFPERLATGSTVLIAGAGEPVEYALGLRILNHFGTGEDTALVVTTTGSADETVNTYEALSDPTTNPSLRLVDATSQQQNVTALYEEDPVVFVTAPGDLERIVIGLSDLTEARPTGEGRRHLLVRSLTPILESAAVDDVRTLLDRITGLRTETGLAILGIDYTAHSGETMSILAEHVDGIIWVRRHLDGEIALEFRPTRGRYNHRTTNCSSND